jgi:hypothetical protein
MNHKPIDGGRRWGYGDLESTLVLPTGFNELPNNPRRDGVFGLRPHSPFL